MDLPGLFAGRLGSSMAEQLTLNQNRHFFRFFPPLTEVIKGALLLSFLPFTHN
jgi:hypothetical protein